MLTFSGATTPKAARAITLVIAFAYMVSPCRAQRFVKVTPAEMKRIMISSPSPQYPTSARNARTRGSGVFLLHVRKQTGDVTRVEVAKSTGSKDLDAAAVSALRRWRLRPRTDYDGLIVPVTFTF
jgi:TonB family protein